LLPIKLIETFFQSFGFRALEFGFSVFGIFLAFGSLEFGILAVLDFWDFGFQYFQILASGILDSDFCPAIKL